MLGTHSKYVHSDGVKLNYFELGNPQGVPLVLVHGFPDSPVSWAEVLSHLDLSGLRVVLPFLRGYGGTLIEREDLLTGEFAALAHDLLALLDVLQIKQFHLAGHDWGARIGYAASVLAPDRVRSLTALASPYVSWGGGLLPPEQVHGYWYQLYFQQQIAETMLRDHRAEFCRELWRVWSPNYHFSDGTFAAAAAAWSSPQFPDIVLDYYRIRWKNSTGKLAYAVLQEKLDLKPVPRINVRTIFIQGDADACDLSRGADGQEVYFSMGYERLVVKGVGHFPHREDPAVVSVAIRRQLRVPGE